MPMTANAGMRDASGCCPGGRDPRPRGPRPSAAVARFATLAALAALTGCATLRPPSPAPPPAGYATPVAGTTLADSLFAATGRRLFAGGWSPRRIALDPGHGGFFRGSVGVNGLTEAEVNLDVALRLRDLLVAHGAEVMLTRETDRDFLSPADSSLRADLNQRVALVNAFRPDLFVSIHHNADAGGSHAVNETQTYWKMTDEAESFEVASDVHRALVRHLGIGTNRLLPGNYAVLRGCDAPGILTESSYLTYPPTEAKLRTETARQIEAEALYRGIEQWVARRVLRGAPSLTGPTLSDDAERTGPEIEYWYRGAFDELEFRVDGAPAPLERLGPRLRWSPSQPLAAGPHEVSLTLRLNGAGSAHAGPTRFTVTPPARRVNALAPIQGAVYSTTDDAALGVRADVTDGFGRPAGEPARVRLRALERGALAPAETLVDVREGVAWGYFVARPQGDEPLRGRSRRVLAELLDTAGVVRHRDTLAVTVWRLPRPDAAIRFLASAAPGRTVAPVTGRDRETADWVNRDGFARLDRPVAPHGGALPLERSLPGWRRAADAIAALADWENLPLVTTFSPLFGGALHGRRIALDPAGNGDVPGMAGGDPAGTSASGLRAADVNLDVARALAAMLRAAGADVRLVRDSRAPVLDVERVRRAESFGAERYLRIGHGPHAPRLGHYFSSGAGRRWAERTAAELAAQSWPAIPVTTDASWTIQQTSCPALYVSIERADTPAGEARLGEPGFVHREAYALLLGLAREWAGDADWASDSLRVLDCDGRPVAGAPVVFGDALVLTADRDGWARFRRTEPGALVVESADRWSVDGRTRGVLLDARRGTVLHFCR